MKNSLESLKDSVELTYQKVEQKDRTQVRKGKITASLQKGQYKLQINRTEGKELAKQ